MPRPTIKRFCAARRVWISSVGILVGAALSTRAADAPPPAVQTPSKPVSGIDAAKEAVRRAYPYNPKVREKAEADTAKKVAEGAVQMDAVIIAEDKNRNPSFENFVARQRQLKAAKKPSLERGAEIPKLPGVGVTPYVDALPFGPPTARWSLIKLPF